MSKAEIEKVKGGELVVPSFLKDVKGDEGLENVRREDLVLPRLAVCQGLSPQKSRSKPTQYIEGLTDGQLFNTVTQKIYGEAVEIVPLLVAYSRIYFRDMKDGGGILCQSFNGIDGGTIAPTCDVCPNSKFSGDKAPVCSNFINVVSLLMPERELIIMSFKSAELKVARTWVTRMKMLRNPASPAQTLPAFANVYDVRTMEQTNPKGTFFVRNMTRKRFVSDDEGSFAMAEYLNLKGKKIKADETDLENEQHDPSIPF